MSGRTGSLAALEEEEYRAKDRERGGDSSRDCSEATSYRKNNQPWRFFFYDFFYDVVMQNRNAAAERSLSRSRFSRDAIRILCGILRSLFSLRPCCSMNYASAIKLHFSATLLYLHVCILRVHVDTFESGWISLNAKTGRVSLWRFLSSFPFDAVSC